MSKMRCKFTCVEADRDAGRAAFHPVYTGSEENDSFFAATPGGNIELSIVNPETVDRLEVGADYYVDFEKAE